MGSAHLDDTSRDAHAGGRPPASGGSHEHEPDASGGRTGPDRRRVLHAAAAGVAGLAGIAGCDTGSGGQHHSATPSGRATAALPGTDDWTIRSRGPGRAIEGYTDRVSALPGETFGLHVSSSAPRFRVSAFRVGWYAGKEAALVWASDELAGGRQPEPSLVSATRTVRAGWDRTLKVSTRGWPEGSYLLRLEASDGHQRYVPFVVRSARADGRTLLMHAPSTWQAYNTWGGYSLYQGRDGSYTSRSLAVSFDRPYAGSGAEKFLVYERALVVLAERLGLPLAYTTGVDVHRDPGVLGRARTAVALGHDEYWTPEQRRHVTAARDAGTNLVFLGANTCYRRVRLEPGPSGGLRNVICYKTAYDEDPYLAREPHMATTDFRLQPGADPESSLTGVIYEGYPTDAPYVVHRAGHWVFRGTGVRDGESFAHLVGVEYDRVDPTFPTPSRIEIVARSPLVCKGRHSHSDSAFYTAPSGAGVFATGTMRWVEALMAGTGMDGRDHGMDARTRHFVTKVTENVLTGFAAGPAATTLPALGARA